MRNVAAALSLRLAELFSAMGLNLEDYHDDGLRVRGRCPCHDSDNASAFVYYKNTGKWRCWTNCCHVGKGDDLVGLVAAKKGMDDESASKWSWEFVKELRVDPAAAERLVRESAAHKIDRWEEHLSQKPFDEQVLDKLSSPREFAEQRGIRPGLLESLGVGYATSGKMAGRVVFPVRNSPGDIVGFTGRLLSRDPGKAPKWIHWPPKRFRSSINLYNVHEAAKHARRHGSMVIGEGPLEVVKLLQAGYRNCVCVFGLQVTAGHVEILKRCGVVHAVLGFDMDRVDSPAVADNIQKLKRADFDVRVLRWRGENDIGDMAPWKVREVMEQVSDLPGFENGGTG